VSEGFKVAMNWGNFQGAKGPRSKQESRVLEMGTLGLTRRGMETSYGSVSEALPEETGGTR